MTKKEIEKLHSEKSSILPTECQLGRGLEHRYVVSMSLNYSELFALKTLMTAADEAGLVGPVGSDVVAYLNNALYRAEIKL